MSFLITNPSLGEALSELTVHYPCNHSIRATIDPPSASTFTSRMCPAAGLRAGYLISQTDDGARGRCRGWRGGHAMPTGSRCEDRGWQAQQAPSGAKHYRVHWQGVHRGREADTNQAQGSTERQDKAPEKEKGKRETRREEQGRDEREEATRDQGTGSPGHRHQDHHHGGQGQAWEGQRKTSRRRAKRKTSQDQGGSRQS